MQVVPIRWGRSPSTASSFAAVNALADLLAEKGHLVLDGAMGTQLFEAGMVAGDAPESWNLSRPDDITAIAKYCARDCVLVSELMARLQTTESMTQMTFICGVAPNKIIWGGCQCQVVAVLEVFVAKVVLKITVK